MVTMFCKVMYVVSATPRLYETIPRKPAALLQLLLRSNCVMEIEKVASLPLHVVTR